MPGQHGLLFGQERISAHAGAEELTPQCQTGYDIQWHNHTNMLRSAV